MSNDLQFTEQELSHITQLLALLEAWVQQQTQAQLSLECRNSGNEFFQYMRQRGVNPGLMQALIKRATGKHPRSLWQVEEAERLRDAILRYQTALIIAKNSSNDPTAIVQFAWEQ
ncbi:MAG: hypothetical protein VKK80_01570 [Prochlorothrix sp.]|nr:hypothetical protein [Prochlorothrix sp.]